MYQFYPDMQNMKEEATSGAKEKRVWITSKQPLKFQFVFEEFTIVFLINFKIPWMVIPITDMIIKVIMTHKKTRFSYTNAMTST